MKVSTSPAEIPCPLRNMVVVLGDQLDAQSAAFDGFDPAHDCVWMAEVREESTHVWTHKARIAIFLSAMRHFRDALWLKGVPCRYRSTKEDPVADSLASALAVDLKHLRPARLIVMEPGEWRLRECLGAVAKAAGVPMEQRESRHFLCTHERFRRHAQGRKRLRMEFFYREMRREHDVLMNGDQPEGGAWNFDKENRGAFGAAGPTGVPPAPSFPPDATTREVFALVNHLYPDHPGSLDAFDWPVTRTQALTALDDFIEHRLPSFGDYQDAMWTGEPFLYHSLLAAALNLNLLNPREVIAAAEAAWRGAPKRYPLNAVEGFIRQLLGWREYVRGVYWLFMPEYLERNALQARAPLPAFYWHGDTEMRCLREAIGQTLKYGYAHHIQRLMVTGLFALLLGVDPREVHKWYLAVYVDAVEWVELPNTLGMSQFGDGGVMASKPYVATGKYIQRMSNYCAGCCYNPAKRTGEDACPFTTLYWDFLLRHREELSGNQRMKMQLRNLERLEKSECDEIRKAADQWRARLAGA